jgi:hypothetical protein
MWREFKNKIKTVVLTPCRRPRFKFNFDMTPQTPRGIVVIKNVGHENFSWTEDQHIVDLVTHPRTNWAGHERAWRKAGGMGTKDSKFYLCHTS